MRKGTKARRDGGTKGKGKGTKGRRDGGTKGETTEGEERLAVGTVTWEKRMTGRGLVDKPIVTCPRCDGTNVWRNGISAGGLVGYYRCQRPGCGIRFKVSLRKE